MKRIFLPAILRDPGPGHRVLWSGAGQGFSLPSLIYPGVTVDAVWRGSCGHMPQKGFVSLGSKNRTSTGGAGLSRSEGDCIHEYSRGFTHSVHIL